MPCHLESTDLHVSNPLCCIQRFLGFLVRSAGPQQFGYVLPFIQLLASPSLSSSKLLCQSECLSILQPDIPLHHRG